MIAPTYSLRPSQASAELYLAAVAQLADETMAAGDPLQQVVDAYGSFVAYTGRETRRSQAEYLLEALALGVLWRARGYQATVARGELVKLLVQERRLDGDRRRDGSTAELLSLHAPHQPGRVNPSPEELTRLLDWLVASGEYDDEVARLEGWELFLTTQPAAAERVLAMMVAYAVEFETLSERILGQYTARVGRFLNELPERGAREDTIQCSRRRIEYHLSMVGAEVLNRAWRAPFLACRRHVVVLPGCARRRSDRLCLARRSETELRCSHCTTGCSVSRATRAATHLGSEALAVVHGSDFSRFLSSPALKGGDVGIVGVACVPGLMGAGWRARAQGLPAQCVLLEASGCAHWRQSPVPTSLDLDELTRILARDGGALRPLTLAVHVA